MKKVLIKLILIGITTVTLHSCKVQYNTSYDEVRSELISEELESKCVNQPILAVKGDEEFREEILGILMACGHGSPSNLTDTGDSTWVSIITSAGDIISMPIEDADPTVFNIIDYNELVSLMRLGYWNGLTSEDDYYDTALKDW